MQKSQENNMELTSSESTAPVLGTSQYPPPGAPSPYSVQPPGQPGAGYPPPPGYGSPYYVTPGVPQQQGVVVVTTQQQPIVLQQIQSYVGLIIFACVVIWRCNWVFGLIAFILAVVASSEAGANPEHAIKLGKASMGLSIIVTVIVVAIVIALQYTVVYSTYGSSSCSTHFSYNYYYDGTCYKYTEYVGEYGYCSGVKSGSNVCYSDSTYCPYYSYLSICYKNRKTVSSSVSCSGVYSFIDDCCYYS